MTDNDLLKEEYLTLRSEVERSMDELSTTERYCLYAVAAGFAWLSTRPLQSTLLGAWFLPPVVVLFAALRSWTIGVQLAWLSQYLGRIEESVYTKTAICRGWEHFLGEMVERKRRCERTHRSVIRRGIRSKVTYAFWIVLFCLSTVFSVAGFSVQSNNELYKWFLHLTS